MINRTNLIKAIHAAKRARGLDETTYQTLLSQHSKGKTSCRDLRDSELLKVLDDLNGKARSAIDKTALTNKLRAQLNSMNLTENYAAAIAKRMFGLDNLNFATPEHLRKIIASLNYQKRRNAQKSEATS